MIPLDSIAILVDLEVAKLYARKPDARLIPSEEVRRIAAEKLFAGMKRRIRQWEGRQ
jgi:hypothetical protein